MILVDTSVWIGFFRGRSVAQKLADHLTQHRVILHEMVYGELLVGGLGIRQEEILKDLSLKDRIPTASLNEIETMVKTYKISGLGLSYIDVHLLYSCLTENHALWTLDKPLMNAATVFGVGI